jgi:hypothetical protein
VVGTIARLPLNGPGQAPQEMCLVELSTCIVQSLSPAFSLALWPPATSRQSTPFPPSSPTRACSCRRAYRTSPAWLASTITRSRTTMTSCGSTSVPTLSSRLPITPFRPQTTRSTSRPTIPTSCEASSSPGTREPAGHAAHLNLGQ